MWRISSRRGTSTPPKFNLTYTSRIPAAVVSSEQSAVSQGQLTSSSAALTRSPLCCSTVANHKFRRVHTKKSKKQGGVVVVSPCQGHSPLPLGVEQDCNRLSLVSKVDSGSDNQRVHCPRVKITSGRFSSSDNIIFNTFVVNSQVKSTCAVYNIHHTKANLMSPL